MAQVSVYFRWLLRGPLNSINTPRIEGSSPSPSPLTFTLAFKMFTSLSQFVLLSILSMDSAFTAAGSKVFRRSPSKGNNAIVQLFEWPWDSVASECTSFLGPAGYGYVQVSPASEHITGSQWWTDYQTVSYKLTSKRGSRTQFSNMVTACNSAGVGVIVDVVFNHMTAGSGTGFAGSTYNKYNYPAVPYTSSNFHYCNGGTSASNINNYQDAHNVQFCELVGLADLAQEQPAVRQIIAAFLNDLLSLGVAGFRIDAAKHMVDTDIAAILGLLKYPFYDTQEVIYGAGEAVQPSQYVTTGDVIEFRAPSAAQTYFTGSPGIAALVTPTPMGAAWGFVDSSIANYIMANQDTERGTTSLNYKSANNVYSLAAIFMLGFNYGTPTVYSGYNFTSFDAGAPQNANGYTNAVTCSSNGWRCEHRWPAIANMIALHNAAGSSALTNILKGTSQQIAFGRGTVGFLVINNDAAVWAGTWITSLSAGTYCDIIHDNTVDPSICNGPSYVVSVSGTFSASVAPHDALALFKVSSTSATTTSSSSSISTAVSSTTVVSSTTTASPTPASTLVVVTFVETASTGTGDVIKVLGSITQLGSWTPTAALALTQPSLNADWRLTLELPPATNFEYKFIRVSSGGSVTWESGSNRVYTTPAPGSTVTLFGIFSSTTSSTSAVTGATTGNTVVPTTTTTSSSSPPVSTGASVTFRESATTSSGEVIKLVGSISQLGNWAAASAIALSNTNSVWSVTLVLPPNVTFQYKFIRVTSGSVGWESDPNRSYTTLSQGSSVTLSSSFR
ncbi:glycoside hydrolase superfamily [Mycena epipterygia]|nr:glycoside hydrolase superfamily [Mycena epipterygia]